MKRIYTFLLFSCFLLCSCKENQMSIAPTSLKTLVKNTKETTEECKSGEGMLVQTGLDSNNNNVLDDAEILNAYIVCDGTDGQAGQNGISTGILITQATTCTAGGINIETFLDPTNTGIFQTGDTITSLSTICNGTNGQDGINGNGIQITQKAATPAQCQAGGIVYEAVLISGEDGRIIPDSNMSAVICSGVTPAFSPVTPIQPCGAASSPYKEILLCLANGQVLSSFSTTMGGDNTRLSFLPAGTYIDTDESGCIFSVSINNNGDTAISWNAGSNMYGSWSAATVTCKAN